MNTFCTIISPDYLAFAKTLYQSLNKFIPGASLNVLLTGNSSFDIGTIPDGIIFTNPGDLNSTLLNDLRNKYEHKSEGFRWSLKPVYIAYLLGKYEKVIYIDCDVHFVSDMSFLFDELGDSSLLLTPHWANPDPFADEIKFMMNFQAGLYNAGFIGATSKALPTLHWWAVACLYAISSNMTNGYFFDQRYLDLVPILDKDAKILRHQGCNIGSWNMMSCKRSIKNGGVVINEVFPVVFIHFNKETITQVLNKNDALLRPYLDEYINHLKENGLDLLQKLNDLPVEKYDSNLYGIKHKTRLRTRLKRFFYKLAEKL